MKLLRLLGYFSKLRALVGFRAACIFTLGYVRNKISPPNDTRLGHIPVGPYLFYFPSLTYFEGLFFEIFLKGTYSLARTDEPIQAIDCGANIGVSLLYIKTRAPRARVVCFEPNPAARAVLEKNIAENKWGNDVHVFPYALGKEKGTVEFFVEGKVPTSSGGGVANYSKNKNSPLSSYMVDVDTLSHYIDGTVDLLKIDIEGGEFDVLEELVAHDALKFVDRIQLEYHYIPGFFTRPLSEMLSLLESKGFRTFVHSTAPPHQVVGNDGIHTYMIFAWHPTKQK